MKFHWAIPNSEQYINRLSFKTVFEDLLALNGSSTVKDSLVSKGTYKLKDLLGEKTVESFSFRTCVKPKLSENRFGDTEITYESLMAQDLLQKAQSDILIRYIVFEATKVRHFRRGPSMC